LGLQKESMIPTAKLAWILRKTVLPNNVGLYSDGTCSKYLLLRVHIRVSRTGFFYFFGAMIHPNAHA
jgi:hypothetical protein